MADKKPAAWRWVTADEKLSPGPCELLAVYATAAAAVGSLTMRHGTNDKGGVIVILEANTNVTEHFQPPEPVPCETGLFVDMGSNITGAFVQWREL